MFPDSSDQLNEIQEQIQETGDLKKNKENQARNVEPCTKQPEHSTSSSSDVTCDVLSDVSTPSACDSGFQDRKCDAYEGETSFAFLQNPVLTIFIEAAGCCIGTIGFGKSHQLNLV